MKYTAGLVTGAMLGAAGSAALLHAMEPRLTRAMMRRGRCLLRMGMRRLARMDLF